MPYPRIVSLKLDAQANLTFPPGQYLERFAECCRLLRLDLDRRGIGIIEQIEEFEHRMHSEALDNTEPPRDAQIDVDKGRRLEVVASSIEVDLVGAVSILINGTERCWRTHT